MPDQNPREEFIQGLKEAEKAAVELKQSIKGLNKQLDELNHILESRRTYARSRSKSVV